MKDLGTLDKKLDAVSKSLHCTLGRHFPRAVQLRSVKQTWHSFQD